jgi:hypothetical protein
MRVIGRVHTSIIIPIRDMLVCFENFEPENNNSCVTTAPTVPPLPVIPDMTPNDLQNHISSYQTINNVGVKKNIHNY